MKAFGKLFVVAGVACVLLALLAVTTVSADDQSIPQTLFIDGYVEDGVSGGNEITTTLPVEAGVAIYNASSQPVHIRVLIPWSFTILDWVSNGTENGTTGQPLSGSWSNQGSYMIFDGYLPCRNPATAGCSPAGTPDFVFSNFQPVQEGSVTFWIVVEEVGFASYTSELLTVNVWSPPIQYWEPYLISALPQEVRVGDAQHLEGENFLPPDTGEYGQTFVAFIQEGQPITTQVTATITALTATTADVIVPELEPGPWKVYLGWPILDGSGWITGNWKDVYVLPPVPPTAVSLSAFTAEIAPSVGWELLALVIVVGSAVFFIVSRNRRHDRRS